MTETRSQREVEVSSGSRFQELEGQIADQNEQLHTKLDLSIAAQKEKLHAKIDQSIPELFEAIQVALPKGAESSSEDRTVDRSALPTLTPPMYHNNHLAQGREREHVCFNLMLE